MGFAALYPSYVKVFVGWVERSETHHPRNINSARCPTRGRPARPVRTRRRRAGRGRGRNRARSVRLPSPARARKSVVEGQRVAVRVDIGGRGIFQKKT